MNKYPNDRKYIRVVKPCIVKFRVKVHEMLNKDSEEWNMVTTNNFSANGIFFFCNRYLEVGTILELKIDFSHFHPSHPSIICIGKITRMRTHMDTSTIGFAIKFTEIDEQDKKVISNIIEEVVARNSHPTNHSLQKSPDQI